MIHNFKEMDCPVCDQYHFSDDPEWLKSEPDYKGKEDDQCLHCGWKYDLEQTENPDLKHRTNEMSLNEYKAYYKQKVAENPNYDYLEEYYVPHPHLCLVCGKHRFPDEDSYDICPICGWEDDSLQADDPNYAGGANDLSLNEYRKQYLNKVGD